MPKTGLRWRVAIVDDHERSRAGVRAAVLAAGGEVAGEAARGADAAAMVNNVRPDVVDLRGRVCRMATASTAAAAVTQASGCPVVLFTSHTATSSSPARRRPA